MRHSKSSQQGSVLVVAVFVIVVMGFLATSLVQVQWSNHDTLTRKQLGTQAWLLAHSANEWALTQVYPLTVSPTVSTSVSTVCSNLNSNQVSRNISTVCHVKELICRQNGELKGIELLKIKATTTCGNGDFKVQRIQEVWVRE